MPLVEGKPLSPGLASGIAVVYDGEFERKMALPHRAISQSDVHIECERIDVALEQSTRDLEITEQNACGASGRGAAEIAAETLRCCGPGEVREQVRRVSAATPPPSISVTSADTPLGYRE